jgi:hypothetical protein
MRFSIISKECSESGETLVEVLVAVLVSALCLLMLATAVGISSNIVNQGRSVANSYYEKETMLESAISSTASSGTVSISSTDTSQNINVQYIAVSGLPGGITAYRYTR